MLGWHTTIATIAIASRCSTHAGQCAHCNANPVACQPGQDQSKAGDSKAASEHSPVLQQAHLLSMQIVTSTSSSHFDSVETVPNTVLALKQALSQQVVVVVLDATAFDGYTGVRLFLSHQIFSAD